MSTVQEIDYDTYEPETTGGKYLRLKEKGQKVRIRIASKPFRYVRTFKNDKTGKLEDKDFFAWVVIDKTQKDFAARAFTGGVMIYLGIKNLAQSKDWGDPETYDLIIERTEKPGSYYTVTPVPKGMGPIPDEQRDMIGDADLDLPTMFAPKEDEQQSAGGSDDYDPFA